METSIFFGGSVIAAFIAGMIALFAPCCISVMLPAYFASSFQNRRKLVAMSFVFAAGIATIILPLVMGAVALRQLFVTRHLFVYLAGGLVMIGMAVFTLLGGKLQLPMPGRRAATPAGPLGVYSLGMFSGVASSCCAPVLAGVIALSSVAPSIAIAIGLGSAYVFGMVAPLFIVSLLWDRVDWRSSGLFRARRITWRLGPIQRTLSASALASGLLLAVMGAATVWIAFADQSMPTPSHWALMLSVRLQHLGRIVTTALSWVPNWLAALGLVIAVGALAVRAHAQWHGQALTEKQHNTPSTKHHADGGDHEADTTIL
ncbi:MULTISPECIES: cytochrome c biogenesis CcdA family protein [Burkholderia]|jgi:cytochrome c-type biogenesis protein|uniref:Cytochrome c biogenesis protein CcdA n=4 Tax=Burkholderia cepacia complex TaxID=87882 RepID=A0AAP1YF53_9BURK|nr:MULTISPECIES: cytochrome c biogenesis CcdA family protein [Burkholderia]EKS9800591.1 cytochrome c biogenesis protein CcdA [Burkholderia cepacia]EKS9807814.1 cytochrome c biogenesis protein CcdA [Burkholderia cepacia]EKS9815414.1 cytochrome c biogenesis protein CcdA [Burkholderia cepacia]EKS9821939.1 cytochrome c biogenesis protein CcdA [Burkholderia cepacia]EKS9829564.1 cytochrome c biogenesis protein CcdA [Burkholderia cepacia]